MGRAYGLQQAARARHGHEIGKAAVELHRRLGALFPDLQKLGSSMRLAVTRYNGLRASLQDKVLPQVRQLENLGIFAPGTELPEVTLLDAPIQPVAVEAHPPAGDGGVDQAATPEANTVVPPSD